MKQYKYNTTTIIQRINNTNIIQQRLYKDETIQI